MISIWWLFIAAACWFIFGIVVGHGLTIRAFKKQVPKIKKKILDDFQEALVKEYGRYFPEECEVTSDDKN